MRTRADFSARITKENLRSKEYLDALEHGYITISPLLVVDRFLDDKWVNYDISISQEKEGFVNFSIELFNDDYTETEEYKWTCKEYELEAV
jgi:hypothetical protein